MANEILILGGRPTILAVFLYAIPSAQRGTYVDGGGVTRAIVPTPVPEEGEVAALLTSAEKTAINAGQAGWESVTFQIDSNLSPADNLTAVQALYATRKAEWLTAQQDRFHRYAQRFDAS